MTTVNTFIDLLTTPPGFKEGMVMDNSLPVNSNGAEQSLSPSEGAQTVSISELLFGNEGREGTAQFIDWGEDEGEGSEQDKVSVEDDVSLVVQ